MLLLMLLLTINGFIVDGKVADFVRLGTINTICGIQSLDTGVFGGIVVGLGVAYLHNRFYMTRLLITYHSLQAHVLSQSSVV